MAVYQVTPTIDTNAYSTGDVIGGKLVLTGAAARNGIITNVTVWDDDGEKDQLDFFFFSGTLTGTSGYTDNAAFAVNAADKAKLFAVISVATTDYFDAGADAVATKHNVATAIRTNNSGNSDITVIAVIRASTTYTAATDLRFEFGVLYD
jgi:hypothetical protein